MTNGSRGRSDPDYARRIEELFAEALDLPVSKRDAFLEEACRGTPDLHAEVASLLQALQREDPVPPGLDAERALGLLEVGSGIPDGPVTVGPYRIERELGRGGMGTVYLARRADGQFEQRVALKLVKRGMDSEAILRRFLTERQILARLQHENVAHLLDGGVSEDGRPFFAMEYVDGTPIVEYCDREQLAIDERLRLFLDVCTAVQYAHRNLVVHRDLKPSNILVTSEGKVKLLDFGIAKLLDHEAEEGLTTLLGARALTPAYAAPEQMCGEPVTTATDVYALGVVLFELLTGDRPYRFETSTQEAMARVVCETEPIVPSVAIRRMAREPGPEGAEVPEVGSVSRDRRTQPERLRRRLQGDLDTVILKALRKEPERRYASAEALRDDLRRHLEGLPVSARPDTLRYRASKFVRRHAVALGVGLAFLVLVVGFAVTASIQRTRTARERDKAEQVKQFVVSLFEVANPLERARGDEITAGTLLEEGLSRVDRELAGEPEIQAEMLAVLGSIYQELGRYDRAGPLLERALALRRVHMGDEDPDLAQSLYDLAAFRRRQRRNAEAESLYREALDLRLRLFGPEHVEVAASKVGLAASLYQQGDYETAEALYREALAIHRGQARPDLEEVATISSNLAHVLRNRGDLDRAEILYREALAVRRRILGAGHPSTATTLGGLATVLHRKGELAAAESLYRESAAIRRQVLGEGHPRVATSMHNLAELLRDRGDLAEAEIHYREAIAIRSRVFGPDHEGLAQSRSGLGAVLLARGEIDEAESLLRDAVAALERAGPENAEDLAEARKLLRACRAAAAGLPELELER